MQLDLFSVSTKPEAEIIRLPLTRIRGRVRASAMTLLGMSKSAGRRHWQRHTADLRRARRAQGFSTHEIDQELDAYARAVSIEIDILSHYRSAPDGAA